MNRVTNIVWRTASGARLGGFAYRYDALGRIVSRTHDLGGAAFDRDYSYDAMDRLAADGDTAYSYDVAELRAVRYRFQGRERSAATGLMNFRMRWYDAGTGRWLSKDPIGLSGGLNLYAFCGDNCLNFIDPDGCVVMISMNPDPTGWGNPAPDWHTIGRRRRNRPLPSRPPSDEDGCGHGWKELPPWQSIYHDNRVGKPERKFVHADGREAVYDGDTNELVTDPELQGTYNYVNSATTGDGPWSWIWRSVGHFGADILPYWIWGN